jgi:uncharacterized membrane protein YphA (DoxX/SURF4 family)
MDVALWIVQGLVAFAFGMAGFGKLTQPYDKLREQMGYINDLSPQTVKIIGSLEILAAIGVLLPAITGIIPELSPTAAVGLMLLMIGAMATHFRRKEFPMIAVNLVLFSLAAFVAYGRFFVETL